MTLFRKSQLYLPGLQPGEHVDFHLTLKLDLDSSVTNAFLKEYERVM